MLSLPVLHPIPRKHGWGGQAGLGWGRQLTRVLHPQPPHHRLG